MTNDKNQERYRNFFQVNDKYLIGCKIDDSENCGYIVFIDYENDIDYIDSRNLETSVENEMTRHFAKLQLAESVPTTHLPEQVQIGFKRKLGAGYLQVLNFQYEGLDKIISDAEQYLQECNRAFSRRVLLTSGIPVVIVAFVAVCCLYFSGNRNPWLYGIVFSVFGAFASMCYGRKTHFGYGSKLLDAMECNSRILIGVIFSVIAMIAIRCRLFLPNLNCQQELFAFIVASFVAAFFERCVPSFLERLIGHHESNSKS